MNAFEAIILGLIQGITEFLPVSSSGHLVMGQTLLGLTLPGVLLEVTVHFATLLSVVIVYRRSLARLVVGVLRREPYQLRFAALILVASIPAGVVGLLLEDRIEAAFDAAWITGVMLLVTGAFLWSTRWATRDEPSDEVPRRDPAAPIELPGWGLAFLIGLAQSFALLPGISRSGATITTGLWGRMRGEAAAEFSFIMSIPAIAGATLLQALELGEGSARAGAAGLALAFIVALVAGVAAIKLLVLLLRRQAFHRFSLYLWPAGLLFLAFLWIG